MSTPKLGEIHMSIYVLISEKWPIFSLKFARTTLKKTIY